MLTLAVETLVEIVGGELQAGSFSSMVNGLAVDSRLVEPGMAFVAFSGARADGHAYLGDAVAAGARALVVTGDVADCGDGFAKAREAGVAVVRVPDALQAVEMLARYHRGRLFCPVVGITGSTGKTTTKEYVTNVLATRNKVVATIGNQNNELGVPLTVLRAGADTDVLVVEMAMRASGEIGRSCEVAAPSAGIVTNIGMTHIETLGSEDAIAEAKAELVRFIPPEGMVFLNADDAYSAVLAGVSAAPVTRYGLQEECEVTARDIVVDSESLAAFTLVTPEASLPVRLAIPGRHNVYNALAAAALGHYLGTAPEDIVAGLESTVASGMRMQSFDSASGVHVINDAYNANPTSMRAAVETLSGYTAYDRRIAVLGDMAELGSLTELAHFRVGELVERSNVDILVTVGDRAARIADGARAAGMDADAIRPCMSAEEASEVLDDLIAAGDVVLVKGSRVMGLERVVEGIVDPRV